MLEQSWSMPKPIGLSPKAFLEIFGVPRFCLCKAEVRVSRNPEGGWIAGPTRLDGGWWPSYDYFEKVMKSHIASSWELWDMRLWHVLGSLFWPTTYPSLSILIPYPKTLGLVVWWLLWTIALVQQKWRWACPANEPNMESMLLKSRVKLMFRCSCRFVLLLD